MGRGTRAGTDPPDKSVSQGWQQEAVLRRVPAPLGRQSTPPLRMPDTLFLFCVFLTHTADLRKDSPVIDRKGNKHRKKGQVI